MRRILATMIFWAISKNIYSMSYFVMATYQVEVKKQKQFMRILKKAETLMRNDHLITKRSVYRMTSIKNPELILEMFEWVNDKSFEKAQKNIKVLQQWGQLETLWKKGGFGVNHFPESSESWAQYIALKS